VKTLQAVAEAPAVVAGKDGLVSQYLARAFPKASTTFTGGTA